MRNFTRSILALLLMVAGAVCANAQEQVHADFASPGNTNTTWDSDTREFTWSTTYYNQLRNIGLPMNGDLDLSKYKKLVVDITMTQGEQIRVLFYQGSANKTLYAKDGVNEWIIVDALKEIAPDDWNVVMKETTEICLSGDNGIAPGAAIINDVYLEEYPEGESAEIPDVVEEEDPGRPEGDYVDLTTDLFNADNCAYNVGVKKAKGDMIYGALNQEQFADLSNYSKLTVVATPGLPLVLTFNHQIDFADKQNLSDYSEAEEGLYVWVDGAADENGIYELDLTQFDPVNLNYIRIPWGFDKQGTVWYLLLTEKESGAMIAWEYDFEKDAEGTAIVGGGSIVDSGEDAFGKVFQNVSGAVRSNYMTLPEDLFANSAESKELSIAFWVNANGNEPSAYTYAPFFTAYGSNSNGAANTWPMLALQSRGNVQVNCEGWCDFGADTQVDGKVNIYNQNAWETGDANFNFVKNWLEDNNWHYYTVTFAETSVKQYLDGEITNEWTIDGSEGKSVAGLFSDGANLKYICLGGNQAWDWNDGDAPFLFDDVLVTNYVLTPEVIKVIIENKGYVAPEPDPEPIVDPELEDGLVEIPQSQGQEYDDFARAELVEGEEYNTYTVNDDLTIAIKMMDVDVEGCDYVVVKFAEPVAAGWKLAFWSNQDLVDVPEGATEFKYVFAEDPKCGVTDGILPQICMMTFFGGYEKPLVAKVVGIYKHQAEGDPTAIKKIDTAAQKANGKYFQNGQIFIMKNGVKYNSAGVMVK